MKLLVVGSSKANETYFVHAYNKIKQYFENINEPFTVVNSDCKGIDRIAIQVANDMGIPTELVTIKTLGLTVEGRSDLFKKIKMANEEASKISDRAVSFTLPYGTTIEKRGNARPKCRYCKQAGLPNNHERSDGCKFAQKVRDFEIIVL